MQVRLQSVGPCVNRLLSSLSLKHGFIFLLLFSALFHFIGPYLYYELVGFQTNYQPQTQMFYDRGAYNIGAAINILGLGVAGIVIIFLPNAKKIIPTTVKQPAIFFIASFAWNLLYLYLSGGFQGVLAGKLLGSWYSYIGIFLMINIAFLLSMGLFSNSSSYLLSSLFVLCSVLNGSRSAPISLLIVSFVLMSVELSNRRKLQYGAMLLVSLVFSVFFFKVANSFRSSDFLLQRIEEVDRDSGGLSHIIGRASFLETSMIPIIFKGHPDEHAQELETFYSKYSLANQLSLFARYFFPGSLKRIIESKEPGFFNFDLLPNQYYRNIFLQETMEMVRKKYTSVNITFPVYVYMYSNAAVAILSYAIVLILSYLLIVFMAKCYAPISLVLFLNIYNLIYFFDATDFLVMLLHSLLTMVAFLIFYAGYERFRKRIQFDKVA